MLGVSSRPKCRPGLDGGGDGLGGGGDGLTGGGEGEGGGGEGGGGKGGGKGGGGEGGGDGGDDGGSEGGEGGSEGGGLGGKMGCFTTTDRALSSLRLRPAATATRNFSVDKLPSSRASASSMPPCLVTESCTLTLQRVLLLTLTLLAVSCGISATSAVTLPSLSERVNDATSRPPPAPQPVNVLPLSSARRRLVTISQVV